MLHSGPLPQAQPVSPASEDSHPLPVLRDGLLTLGQPFGNTLSSALSLAAVHSGPPAPFLPFTT